jgi:hypothetical protein
VLAGVHQRFTDRAGERVDALHVEPRQVGRGHDVDAAAEGIFVAACRRPQAYTDIGRILAVAAEEELAQFALLLARELRQLRIVGAAFDHRERLQHAVVQRAVRATRSRARAAATSSCARCSAAAI